MRHLQVILLFFSIVVAGLGFSSAQQAETVFVHSYHSNTHTLTNDCYSQPVELDINIATSTTVGNGRYSSRNSRNRHSHSYNITNNHTLCHKLFARLYHAHKVATFSVTNNLSIVFVLGNIRI